MNNIKIYVEDTGLTYRTLSYWGLALGNNNYISSPQLETYYIDVPYRDGLIDASTVVAGRPVYKSRQLSFELGGIRPKDDWDNVISEMRNAIHGRICQLTLDNDPLHYWRGRVYIEDFDRKRGLGTFKLKVPQADPYKYDVYDSTDSRSETYIEPFTLSGSKYVSIHPGYMPVNPSVDVREVTSDRVYFSCGSATYDLEYGLNKINDLWVNGDKAVTFYFHGDAKIKIIFRGGSL